jgi:hypothetical protein
MKKYYGLKVTTDRVAGREVKKYKFQAAVEALAAAKAKANRTN